MSFTVGAIFFMLFGAVFCAPSETPCPDPISPENGQIVLYKEGYVVKYICDIGYALKGKDTIRCVDGKWEEPNPVCMEIADKSESTLKTINATVESGDDAQLTSLSADEMPMSDEGYQSDEALRHLYWYAHYYPNQVYYGSGAPGVVTLTESQINWIHSLHPELRDQYLKGMHIIRVADGSSSERTQALIARDAYNYVYHSPYLRRSASLVVDNVPSTYDYSCNQAGYPAIPAPRLKNMRIARYDSRKNIYEPHNYYLSAIYQCDAGYYMLDSRFTELYCSRGQWVGISPVCVAH